MKRRHLSESLCCLTFPPTTDLPRPLPFQGELVSRNDPPPAKPGLVKQGLSTLRTANKLFREGVRLEERGLKA